MNIRKIKRNLRNIKGETTYNTLTIHCFSHSRLGCIVNPTLITIIECVSSMITSVIVPMGHGNEEREKKRVERSYDEIKERKKNEVREDRI